MIQTTKEQIQNYSSLNPYFPAAFAALAKMAEEGFERGRHPVDGDNIYINALEYDTHPVETALMEAHRSYIDVMWIVSGEEEIGVCPLAAMTEITQPYDAAGDAVLAKIPDGCTSLQMKPGSVCILFPEDGHAPGLDSEGTCHVQKLIAKVRVV